MSITGTTVVYRPRKWKLFLQLLLSSALLACGIVIIGEGAAFGWVVSGVFGLCAGVLLLQFMPNCAYLRVSLGGLEIRSLFRSHTLDWEDIDQFYAGRVGKNKMVLVKFAASCQKAQTAKALARKMTGAEGALPDTYGFAAEALADHLNHWKQLAANSEQTQRPAAPTQPDG